MSSFELRTPSPAARRRLVQRARYRAGQFWRGLSARISEQEQAQAAEILPPQAQALFARMPVDAQRHSFNVLHAVHAMGLHDPELDAAALLHDVGKVAAQDGGVRLSLWLRSPLVLLDAWAPGTLRRLASAETRSGWQYTAYVYLEHPRLGAELAAAAGCSELTCWLIRHHQDEVRAEAGTREDRLLAALQAADDSS